LAYYTALAVVPMTVLIVEIAAKLAQLATFSQVEQSVQINNKLDSILQASTFAQAGDLIGKYITSPDKEVAGYIKEVRLYSDGILAILENGDQLPVWAGVTITNTAPPEAPVEPGEEDGQA
jgi:flagellar hook assembly protein FlgD